MEHYIVGTVKGPQDPEQYDEREKRYYTPVQAPDPETAVYKRGVVPEDCLKVYVYHLKSTETNENPVTTKVKD